MIRRRHWTLAAVTAVALHALVFSVFAQKNDHGADFPDQQGIEVELGMLGDLGGVSEISEEENEPQTTVAPPAEVEPIPEPEAIPEPELIPEPEPDPIPEPVQKAEVQVKPEPAPKPKPKPKPIPKPEPKPEPKPVTKAVSTITSNKPVDVNASPAQARNVAGETSRPDGARTGGTSAAAAAAAAGARESWYAQVAAHLARHKHYPMRARRMRHEAIVTLSFVVARDGSVRQSEITGPSKYQALNQAVEEMLARAKPLPAFPKDLPGNEVSLSIPVAFKLQ